MTRTEEVLRKIVEKYDTSPNESRTDCWMVSIQQRDLARQELAAIEAERKAMAEPITEEWLALIGFLHDAFGIKFKFLTIRIRSSGECDSWIVNTIGESAAYLSTAMKTRGDVLALLAALKTPVKGQ